MSTYQKVVILGNLGRDPEVKYTQSGTAVCSLTVATTRKWKDKQSGEQQEDTEWHRVVAYDRLAEIIGEYAKKGKSILIDGRLKTRKWEKDGVTHYTTEIVAESMQLLGGRDDGEPRQQRQQAPSQQRNSRPSNPLPSEIDDDSIPF